MQTLVVVLSLTLSVTGSLSSERVGQEASSTGQQRSASVRQLSAVRGEVVKITVPAKGSLLITVRPAKEFPEVIVLARENDLVGSATGREGGADLLGLLSEDPRDDEAITAAELNEGDVVSVIYDPQLQNRALEIYLH
jgi:DNA-directed RNA polymerase subunit H (RpoH/RPB5)